MLLAGAFPIQPDTAAVRATIHSDLLFHGAGHAKEFLLATGTIPASGIRVGFIPTTEKMLYLTGFGFNQLTQLAFVEPESTTLVAMVHLQITHIIRRQYQVIALRTVHPASVAVGDHQNRLANL